MEASDKTVDDLRNLFERVVRFNKPDSDPEADNNDLDFVGVDDIATSLIEVGYTEMIQLLLITILITYFIILIINIFRLCPIVPSSYRSAGGKASTRIAIQFSSFAEQTTDFVVHLMQSKGVKQLICKNYFNFQEM